MKLYIGLDESYRLFSDSITACPMNAAVAVVQMRIIGAGVRLLKPQSERQRRISELLFAAIQVWSGPIAFNRRRP